MSLIDVDKWPVAYQAAALIGAAVIGGVVYLQGLLRKTPKDAGDQLEQVRLELANKTRDLADRKLRGELEQIVASHRESINVAMEKMKDHFSAEVAALRHDVHDVEVTIARLRPRD